MTLNMGPPKIRKNASKKNKKSWRKNVDMTEVENFLEEQRLEERTTGLLALKENSEIFMLDTGGEERKEKRRKKKEKKPLKCHSMLDGLPGVPDPKPVRPRIRTAAERMNPVVQHKKDLLAKAGVISKKTIQARNNRAEHLRRKKASEADRKTRRRTKFDFDLWDEEEKKQGTEGKEDGADMGWVSHDTRLHTAAWTNSLVPKAANNRKVETGSLLPAVEVPHPGASYNPALADHQELLMQAALVEMAKEKEAKRIERATTRVFAEGEAPTKHTYLQEMSEGIPELGAKDEDDASDEEDKVEEVQPDVEQIEIKSNKPKTRKQRRDLRIRAHEQRKLKSLRQYKLKEDQVFKIKSMRKELKAAEHLTKQRQAKKAEEKEEKMRNPIQLSKYKYDAPDIEIKLSDELTGNLRNLKPEGSLLEDRYKSLQRRNIIETRVVQKAVRQKTKKVDKRSHKMGWEEEAHKQANRRRNRRKAAANKLKEASAL